MATTKKPGVRWLERAAGQQLDALEDALTAFDPNDAQTLGAIHRQLKRIETAARRAGFTGAAAMARQAIDVAPAAVRPICSALTALLRASIRSVRQLEDRAAGDLDVPQIALCDHASRCALHGIRPEEAPVGTLVLRIENLDAIRERHGEEGTIQARTHVLRTLRRMLRTGDCLAQTGGHCFIVFLPGEDVAGLRAAFKRMRAAVQRTRWAQAGSAGEPLRLTICGAPAGVAQHDAPVAAEAPARVAVVSASPSFARALGPMLVQTGCTVSASGAPGAQLWTAMKREPPRIVLVDIPSRDLESVLETLADQLRGRRIPVVALVADEASAALALEHGVRTALQKPVKAEELLSTFRRLSRRGSWQAAPTAQPVGAAACILVASDSVPQLIAIGTSLQKRIGCDIRLCRGSAEAIARAQELKPSVAVLDLTFKDAETDTLLKALGAKTPAPRIVLIADGTEHARFSAGRQPRVAEVIRKPVSLLELPDRIAKAAGLLPAVGATDSFEVFRSEIQRVIAGA
jgi:PleD family two-component response regulator